MSNETILVVDDSRQIANFLAEKLLPSMGFETLVAHDGKSALSTVKTHPIALMLLDLQLPDYSGLDVLQQLAKEGYNIPTILITAEGSEKIAVEAFRLGVQDYLIKPIDSDELNEAVTRALVETRLRNEKARLTAQLNEQISWLTVLSKVGQSVASTLDLDEVLRRIVEAGVYLTRADEGFLALLDDQSGQIYLRAVKNIEQDKIRTLRAPVNDSLLGSVIRSGRPLRTSQSTNSQPLKVSTGFLVHSLLHVPILSKGKPLGVLSVDNRGSKRSFTEADEAQLTSLVDYAAVALENARLYQQAQQEITERTRVESALRESEERFALAVRGANDGLWDWDFTSELIYYSPRWKSMLGYNEDEIGYSPEEWFKRVHPEDIERTKLDISAHLKGVTLHFENEHRMLHKDGTYRWILSRGLAVWNAKGIAHRMAGSQTDITDRKYAEQKLLRDAFYDTLTSLANRALFIDRLKYSVERAKRKEKYLFAVLFLDLDRFKDVNDSLGHMLGDQLLVAVARMLEGGLRATDTVARLGGDEFVILLEDINHISDATRIADWVQNKFEAPFQLNGHEVFITTSIGIVLSATGYNQPEDVLRDADIAMYVAKANGKSRFEIFDPTMRERIMERLSLENDLRQAIEREELRVHYQPIILLDSGKIIGFEALARWQHPQRGLLAPIDFIPMAEENGLILLIDRWVMREACQHMVEWHKESPQAPPLTISVNISGKQILQPDLIEFVDQTLQETGLEARFLKLEITETTIMEKSELTMSVFKKLQDLGVQVQIDDFGIGYSSLSYLSHFPINALKIDHSFVSKMAENGNHLQIIQAIITLTQRLGVGVIAEGVETEGQLNQLKELGCEFGQGYLVSRPIDEEAVKKLLKLYLNGGKIFTPENQES